MNVCIYTLYICIVIACSYMHVAIYVCINISLFVLCVYMYVCIYVYEHKSKSVYACMYICMYVTPDLIKTVFTSGTYIYKYVISVAYRTVCT